MKTLLTALNSQYIHSCLAVWQLKAVCTPECGEVIVREWNINQQISHIYSEILQIHPEVIAFSCYIWNIETVLKLAQDLKTASPDIKILFGGPEVSFDSAFLLRRYPFIDWILLGEGEVSLPAVLRALNHGEAVENIPGVTARGHAASGSYQFVSSFAGLPSPYTADMLAQTDGKILYYEGSRGCPFQCAYCLSQIGRGVREKPLERVMQELELLQAQGIPLIKFVDRTFNCNRERSAALWRYLAKSESPTRFHFEIGGDLLDDEQISILGSLPPGKVQLEIGVQTTNPEVLANVCRKTAWDRLAANVRRLLSFQNIHIHLDLIAGLPGEDLRSFRSSFNDVYTLHPHALQLGFLKLLKGSRLRADARKNGCHYRNYPPYEVLATRELSAEDLIRLKGVEEMLDRYYNSGRFQTGIAQLSAQFPAPFDFYDCLREFHEETGSLHRPIGAAAQYALLAQFASRFLSGPGLLRFEECLRFDYFHAGMTGKLPDCLCVTDSKHSEKEGLQHLLETSGFEMLGLERPAGTKEMHRRYRLAYFSGISPDGPSKPYAVVFDTFQKNPVTGLVHAVPFLLDEAAAT